MTDFSQDLTNEWMEAINASIKFRKKHYPIDKLRNYRDYYRSKWKKGIIPVNRIFSSGRSLIPSVYFRLPRVSVTATKPEMVVHARVVEEVDNWLIRETLLKHTLKTAVLHSYLGGTAPIKLGYDSEFGYQPTQAIDEDSSTLTQEGLTEERKVEYNVGVKPGMPWALPELPENVIIPIGYRDPHSLPWIAHRILRPLDDVKQDQKYNPKEVKELVGTRKISLAGREKRSVFDDSEDKVLYAELFEVRDASRKHVYVFCENHQLLGDVDALQIEGLNWEFLTFNEDPEYFEGIPDAAIIEPQQLELNEIRTQAQRHRAIALLKFLYLKGSINETALTQFLSGKVGPAIEIDGESLAQAVQILQPHIPADLANEATQVKQDIRESVGISENQGASFRGGTPPSATETMQVSQSFDLRTDERKDAVRDLLVNIIRKWNQYIFSFWTGERVARIVGPGGEESWIKYTGDQLKGEYSLNIDPDTGFPASKQLRLQTADAMFKQYSGDQLIDQIGLRRMHLGQYEWLFPGISNLVKQDMAQQQADIMSLARQPHPGGLGGGSGNRGGGRTGSPERPLELESIGRK